MVVIDFKIDCQRQISKFAIIYDTILRKKLNIELQKIFSHDILLTSLYNPESQYFEKKRRVFQEIYKQSDTFMKNIEKVAHFSKFDLFKTTPLVAPLVKSIQIGK